MKIKKPLLAPARRPNNQVLRHELGISASGGLASEAGFLQNQNALREVLGTLVRSKQQRLVSDDCSPNGTRTCAYELLSGGTNEKSNGTINLSCLIGSPTLVAVTARLLRSALPVDFDAVVVALDALWSASTFDAMYAYDEDDMTIQNMKLPFAAEEYGLIGSQCELIQRGPLSEIDTRSNPGFMNNSNGILLSVQWLNYWSNDAMRNQVTVNPEVLSGLIKIAEMKQRQGVRIQLSDEPWSYDDVLAHQKQMQIRKLIGLSSIG